MNDGCCSGTALCPFLTVILCAAAVSSLSERLLCLPAVNRRVAVGEASTLGINKRWRVMTDWSRSMLIGICKRILKLHF